MTANHFAPLIALLLIAPLRAELPSIRLDRVTPLGGAAGVTVEVQIAGADNDDARSLFFDHPGLRAEFLKDRTFRVSIDKDVPAGTYDVRLVGRFGVSNPRLFAVSHGLTEVAKKEPNLERGTAQLIAVNTVVNGQSGQNREDFYRFPLKKAQRVVIECQAGKLDSMLDGTLVLTDGDGKQLGASSNYNGRDPLIDFIAPSDGEYYASIHDLSFRGGHPYRLIVTDHPQVENIFPRAVQIGKPSQFTAFGRNLGKGAKPSTWRIQDLALEETTLTITPPADVFNLGAYRFHEHPTCFSVLPTAATCTLTGFEIQPRFGDFTANSLPLLLVDTPVTVEVEPNDDREHPQAIRLPAVVSGRFDKERDADWYEFETAEAGQYSFEVYCERIGGQADAYLVVVDDKGNRVAELDDFGHRMNAFDGHLRDPSGMVNLNARKKYRVLVQDRYQRGGARFQYVLTIHKPVPDFHVAVIHSQNPGPGGTTIRRGGTAYLDVITHFKDGYNGPITITAEGLPKGLHALPTNITDSRGIFVLWADADAPEWTGTVKLVATGKRGDEVIRREVRPYTRVWTQQDMNSSRPTRELALAIRESSPFALRFVADRLEVEAGSKTEVKVRLDRLWPEFKNAVNVLSPSLPNGVKIGNVSLAPDKTEAMLTLELSPNVRPGEYTIAVQGQAQVPYSKDDKATTKPNTLVSQPSQPVTLVVVGARKK